MRGGTAALRMCRGAASWLGGEGRSGERASQSNTRSASCLRAWWSQSTCACFVCLCVRRSRVVAVGGGRTARGETRSEKSGVSGRAVRDRREGARSETGESAETGRRDPTRSTAHSPPPLTWTCAALPAALLCSDPRSAAAGGNTANHGSEASDDATDNGGLKNRGEHSHGTIACGNARLGRAICILRLLMKLLQGGINNTTSYIRIIRLACIKVEALLYFETFKSRSHSSCVFHQLLLT